MDGMRLEHVLEFKYLDMVSMNQVQMMKSVVGRKRMGEKFQVLLVPWLMVKVCSLSVQGIYMRYGSVQRGEKKG